MTLLAAALTGVAVYLAARALVGLPVALPRRRRHSGGSPAQVWLLQAGLAVTPRQFWAASLLAGAVVGAAVVVFTGTPAVALAPAAFAVFAPRLYFARQRVRRLREVAEAWPDGLRELVAGVAAGMSLPHALVALAERGPAPLRDTSGASRCSRACSGSPRRSKSSARSSPTPPPTGSSRCSSSRTNAAGGW